MSKERCDHLYEEHLRELFGRCLSCEIDYVTHRLVRAEAELLKSSAKALETDYMKQFPEPYIPGQSIPASRTT